jgi:uncharacterized protein DUF3883
MDQTAGWNARYPKPEATLRAGVALGLARQEERYTFSMTPLGVQFRSLGRRQAASMTQAQGLLLLSLLLDEEGTALAIRRLFAELLRNNNSGRYELRQPLGSEEHDVDLLRVLQQCGVLEYVEGLLMLVDGVQRDIPRELFRPKGMTEEELLHLLDAQRARGRAAEEFVVKLERARLEQEGRRDLAQHVIRVSESDIAAGYDIRSFSSNGAPRYIEVKSSVGRELRFEWSEGERERAASLAGAYWVYFVPLARDLHVRPLPVAGICDPISHVQAGRLVERPLQFEVRDARPGGKSECAEYFDA